MKAIFILCFLSFVATVTLADGAGQDQPKDAQAKKIQVDKLFRPLPLQVKPAQHLDSVIIDNGNGYTGGRECPEPDLRDPYSVECD